jgi:methionyl-tRNA formyltransferase
MRTVLLVGKGPSARTALESLAERFTVVGVIRKARGGPRGDDEVERCARERGVPLLTDTSPEGVRRAVTLYRPHCTVVSSYDRILDARTLSCGQFVNVHYSLLPKYRGLAAVQWSMINGEPEFGITVHAITRELDAGNVLCQRRVTAGAHETVSDIYAKLNEIQRQVLGATVERYLSGDAGVPQDELAATYACARLPEDSEIDWSDSTERIDARIRAFHEELSRAYPEAYTYADTRRFAIVRAAPVPDAPPYAGRVPGRVVRRSAAGGYVDVLSGDGVLRIHEVMTGDGTVRPAPAVIRSTKQTLGLRTADVLERIEALSRRLDLLAGPHQVPPADGVGAPPVPGHSSGLGGSR